MLQKTRGRKVQCPKCLKKFQNTKDGSVRQHKCVEQRVDRFNVPVVPLLNGKGYAMDVEAIKNPENSGNCFYGALAQARGVRAARVKNEAKRLRKQITDAALMEPNMRIDVDGQTILEYTHALNYDVVGYKEDMESYVKVWERMAKEEEYAEDICIKVAASQLEVQICMWRRTDSEDNVGPSTDEAAVHTQTFQYGAGDDDNTLTTYNLLHL